MNTNRSIQQLLSEMFTQSLEVITRPSVANFEKYEGKGGLREAAIYVAIGAALAGILNLLTGSLAGFLSTILSTLFGFFVFVYLVHYVGSRQGGTGTLEQVAYTFSLFWVPISVTAALLALILVITVVGILLVWLVPLAAFAAYVYLGYLAVQSSLNLTDSSKAWLTLIVAGAASLVINLLVAALAAA